MSAFHGGKKKNPRWRGSGFSNLCPTLLMGRWAFGKRSFLLFFGRTCASLPRTTWGFFQAPPLTFMASGFQNSIPPPLCPLSFIMVSLCPFYHPAPAPVTVDATPRFSTGRVCAYVCVCVCVRGVTQARLALARPAQATL